MLRRKTSSNNFWILQTVELSFHSINSFRLIQSRSIRCIFFSICGTEGFTFLCLLFTQCLFCPLSHVRALSATVWLTRRFLSFCALFLVEDFSDSAFLLDQTALSAKNRRKTCRTPNWRKIRMYRTSIWPHKRSLDPPVARSWKSWNIMKIGAEFLASTWQQVLLGCFCRIHRWKFFKYWSNGKFYQWMVWIPERRRKTRQISKWHHNEFHRVSLREGKEISLEDIKKSSQFDPVMRWTRTKENLTYCTCAFTCPKKCQDLMFLCITTSFRSDFICFLLFTFPAPEFVVDQQFSSKTLRANS